MKKFFFIVFLIIFISCSNREEPNSGMKQVLTDLNNSHSDFAIIPLPDSIIEINKGKFQMNSKTKIFTSVETISEAYYLLSFIKGKPNNIRYRLDEVQENLGEYGIYLLIDSEIEGDEAYQLKVTENYVKISASSEKGVFYGIQSLRQLMPDIAEQQEAGSENELIAYVKRGVIGNNMTVPFCEIYDHPKFEFRGMQLDVSRHFFSIDFIKKYIDILAMHKMNYFIWHLSDDQGWRAEIRSFPELTRIGAKRQETMVGKNFDPFKGDGEEYFYFYTQEEIREVVSYAEDRHIEIIPEISFPGHASAILAAYPGLGNQRNYSVKTTWGEFDNYIYPTSQAVAFLNSILAELNSLFPSKYIQVSGLSDKQIIDRELRQLGFKNEAELYNFFENNAKSWFKANNKTLLIPNNLGFVEASEKEGFSNGFSTTKYASQNKSGVFVKSKKLNFEFYPSRINGQHIFKGGYLNVGDVYNLKKSLFVNDSVQSYKVLGGQAQLYTEYAKTSDEVEYLLLPRLTALSEVLWSDRDSLPGLWPRNKNLYGKFKAKSYKYSGPY